MHDELWDRSCFPAGSWRHAFMEKPKSCLKRPSAGRQFFQTDVGSSKQGQPGPNPSYKQNLRCLKGGLTEVMELAIPEGSRREQERNLFFRLPRSLNRSELTLASMAAAQPKPKSSDRTGNECVLREEGRNEIESVQISTPVSPRHTPSLSFSFVNPRALM
ncbi:hypothetical protein IE53DRAFT_255173 [Violaceomyces palustris]|uniref:Uncharacterized protein n=1 Tax=Violaceomyces palustris TaxID=1673888 RepID=A0ACD0P3U7_9BASI|nr:hypothetical protein IE53DRAFT_255173 [Violaceomyces palustris]